eukprot:gnl/TRDRNA2_/TRDRNA2_36978_c0_seq1.p1 gnl/TRDRNA2_/TRDRNA2_36978_c0~~gnl/TRDRNA2_/TRDRNA2_36978_c0_seq1.p1  ORF type:complete len:601 (+),score=92.00 gnl/TRDRNA2_/TRDRNA2_36978_c0_seq1:91-1893(+)
MQSPKPRKFKCFEKSTPPTLSTQPRSPSPPGLAIQSPKTRRFTCFEKSSPTPRRGPVARDASPLVARLLSAEGSQCSPYGDTTYRTATIGGRARSQPARGAALAHCSSAPSLTYAAALAQGGASATGTYMSTYAAHVTSRPFSTHVSPQRLMPAAPPMQMRQVAKSASPRRWLRDSAVLDEVPQPQVLQDVYAHGRKQASKHFHIKVIPPPSPSTHAKTLKREDLFALQDAIASVEQAIDATTQQLADMLESRWPLLSGRSSLLDSFDAVHGVPSPLTSCGHSGASTCHEVDDTSASPVGHRPTTPLSNGAASEAELTGACAESIPVRRGVRHKKEEPEEVWQQEQRLQNEEESGLKSEEMEQLESIEETPSTSSGPAKRHALSVDMQSELRPHDMDLRAKVDRGKHRLKDVDAGVRQHSTAPLASKEKSTAARMDVATVPDMLSCVGAEILLTPPGHTAKYWGRIRAARHEVVLDVDFGEAFGVVTIEPSIWKAASVEEPPAVGMRMQITPPGCKAKYWGSVVARRLLISIDVDFGGDVGLKTLEPSQWKDCIIGRDNPSLHERCSCGRIAALCKKCNALKPLAACKQEVPNANLSSLS